MMKKTNKAKKTTVQELQQLIELADKAGLNLSSSFLKKAIKGVK